MAAPADPDVPAEENDGSPERTDELLAQSRSLLSELDARLSAEPPRDQAPDEQG